MNLGLKDVLGDVQFDPIPDRVLHRVLVNRAIIREEAATQACAMEMRTFGDVKYTADEYKAARTHRMALEAN